MLPGEGRQGKFGFQDQFFIGIIKGDNRYKRKSGTQEQDSLPL
jgi:hypothetical protein